MASTTNNKPCAQHTETSGGRLGHTSRTVTLSSSQAQNTLLSSAFYVTKMKISKFVAFVVNSVISISINFCLVLFIHLFTQI